MDIPGKGAAKDTVFQFADAGTPFETYTDPFTEQTAPCTLWL